MKVEGILSLPFCPEGRNIQLWKGVAKFTVHYSTLKQYSLGYKVMLRMGWLDKEEHCTEQESRLGHSSLPDPLSFPSPFQTLYILKLFELRTNER